jgi:hypothetical protein
MRLTNVGRATEAVERMSRLFRSSDSMGSNTVPAPGPFDFKARIFYHMAL